MKNYMFKISLLFILIIFSVTQTKAHNFVFTNDSVSTTNKKVHFTIRLGQGGFKDYRSPINKLGGGQLALDIKPVNFPVGFTISNENYTNSASPDSSYEISNMFDVNCFYYKNFLKNDRLKIFAGAGFGSMTVPQGAKPDARSILFNIEAGFNTILIWKLGLYASYKYLYANKGSQINFSEHIFLIGITFNFGL